MTSIEIKNSQNYSIKCLSIKYVLNMSKIVHSKNLSPNKRESDLSLTSNDFFSQNFINSIF